MVQAVNYRHHGGATKLDFAGTDQVHLAQTLFLRASAIPIPFNSSHVSVA
jgi:hypothetical protein